MRTLIVLLALASQAWATKVTGTLTLPTSGDLVNGACVYQKVNNPFGTSGPAQVITAPVTVGFGQPTFTRGHLEVTLVPTETGVPGGQYYQVTCTAPAQMVNGHQTQATSWRWYWSVPDSVSTLDVLTVLIDQPTGPPVTLTAQSPITYVSATRTLGFDTTANVAITGTWDFLNGATKFPQVLTPSDLPSASTHAYQTYVVKNSGNKALCDTGGGDGTTPSQCWSNGTSWVAMGGGGIQSLNGLTGLTQTFSRVDDTNVTLGISSSSTQHTFTLGWTGTLGVSRGGTGIGTLTGIIRGNGTSAFSAATAADVVGLFSTCSSTQYLGADGACHTSLLSLNGLTTNTQTFAGTDDTNVTLSVTSNTSTHTFALGWTGQLSVSRGGTGVSTLSGLVKANGTSAFSAAASTDVIGLFSGCSGSMYLGADGACHSVSTGISGTQYKLVRFATASTLGDSHISEDGTTGQITTDRLVSTPPCSVVSGSSVALDFRDCDTITVGTLGSDVSAVTLSNLKPGAHLTVYWTQDGTGGRTVAMPVGASNLCSVEPTASKSTVWQMDVAADGSTVTGTGCSTNMAWVQWSGPTGSGCAGSVASGTLCAWFDSSSNTNKIKDSSGNIYVAVKSVSGATANQFLTYVDSSGVQHTAAIAAGDLPATVMQTNTTNTVTGYNNLSGGTWRAPETVAASLPTASTVTGRIYVVTDAARIGDCSTTGGGTKVVGCRSNGTTYDCVWRCAVTIASGSTAMGTSAIASGACATVVTATATGTLTTDVLTASFAADPTSTTGYTASTTGMLTIIPYPTANTANFKVCNLTSASITPGAVTINWRVSQ